MIPAYIKTSILLLILFGHAVFAQDNPIVRFDDLQFNSEFEKKTFTDIQEGSPEYLKLFLAVSPVSDENLFVNINEKLLQIIEEIADKKFLKLKEAKKVSKIYEIVNRDILKRYQEQTLFPDVFSTGYFNCLTASAYYGFLFTRLGIDFEFKESSNHVHPVAYPKTFQIKVETTDPINGFQYFDSRLKAQFVNYLLNAKIISREEASENSVDDIFNKYYFPESSIGLKELAGLQYLNDAFYNFGQDKFDNALIQIQKAYYLYPSNRISTVLLFFLSRCLAETRYDSVEDAKYLILASRFVGTDLKKEEFIAEIKEMTEKVLFQRSQTELYYQLCEYLLSTLDKGEMREAVEIEFYSQKGEILMTTFHVREALSNFEKALEIEPENLDLQTVTVKCLAFSFGSSPNHEIVNSIENFERRFPVMHTNQTFITLQMLAYLQLAAEKYDFEEPGDGKLLLDKFERLFKLYPGISLPYEKVGDAYSAAAVFYFKRNEKAKSREYLNRGLLISPDNYQLMYRLRALE